MNDDTAAGYGPVASQGPTAPPAETAATPAASPFAGPTPPTPSRAGTAAVSPRTMILPAANTRRGRHSLSQVASDRWLRRLVVVAGVTFIVSLATAATMLFTGGSADRNAAPLAAESSATADATLEPTTEPLPSPTSEPAPSPTAAQRPADVIAGIQVGLTQLVQDGQLEEGSAEDLESRLDDVSDALADGETDEAWHKLRKAAEELREIREDEQVTRTGYQALAAALSQLAQTLPQR